MKQTYCNPLDLNYRYQHMKEGTRAAGFREGADPTLASFKGTYYLFVSMSAGFWHSSDLLHWEFHPDEDLLFYDYAPDVRQVGEYLYFCASRKGRNCPILRSKDPLHEPFEEVSAPFDFWDPNLFCDDDGRVYLYWGCANTTPIWGVEMDPETMTPIGEKRELIFGHETESGYERPGDNGIVDCEASVVYQSLKRHYNPETGTLEFPLEMQHIPGISTEALTAMFFAVGKPYIEGAFMTKHDGVYYLQYACPGTQYNTYADGVYTARSPLGPFTRQVSNPFSAVPGGFMTGAGHGSTIADRYGNYWHAATMRISVNHDFERRVGLFPAGFDKDGVLFCNQNFADYPHRIPAGRFDAADWRPEWMLLSYRKPVTVSSTAEGSAPSLAVNENCRNWWSAGRNTPGEWLCVNLGKECDVRAIMEFELYEELEAGGEKYVLVHAGPDHFSADRPLWDYEIHELIWTRLDYSKVYYHDRFLVTGHTPVAAIPGNEHPDAIFRANRHIAIDCGCIPYGCLGAICLDTGEEFYVKRTIQAHCRD